MLLSFAWFIVLLDWMCSCSVHVERWHAAGATCDTRNMEHVYGCYCAIPAPASTKAARKVAAGLAGPHWAGSCGVT